ncbi:hypothetical protein DACRYDRAFT_103489 [Dacryopinax primogenitus]|uniref:Uncharacterized protein n=1 Tax=Dacryopinax primogenitus (strain DJM 731) TaxID=1858805 RepID=M5GFS0_DACPD|nr:uncharacterized protein DACRYDRAFT_103489 [Dacryopinax primogenitus]EJU06542.1 hypothetical protein DACRYDRAFT_103489 [Dacryopinax primogenitus]
MARGMEEEWEDTGRRAVGIEGEREALLSHPLNPPSPLPPLISSSPTRPAASPSTTSVKAPLGTALVAERYITPPALLKAPFPYFQSRLSTAGVYTLSDLLRPQQSPLFGLNLDWSAIPVDPHLAPN